MDASFRRYRFLSFVTGTTLLLLIVVAVPLKHFAGIDWPDRVIGISHGVILYPIYLVMAMEFAVRARVKLALAAGMILAGFIPGLAFYVEHRIHKRYYPNGVSPSS
jgi:integral membrane protein